MSFQFLQRLKPTLYTPPLISLPLDGNNLQLLNEVFKRNGNNYEFSIILPESRIQSSEYLHNFEMNLAISHFNLVGEALEKEGSGRDYQYDMMVLLIINKMSKNKKSIKNI